MLKRPWLAFGVAGAVLLLLLACCGMDVPLQGLLVLAFGWVFYLARVLPQMRIGIDSAALGLICIALFTLGLHAMLRSGSKSLWKWRWSAQLVALLLVAFVAGLASVGFTYQVLWAVKDPEPWVSSGSEAARRMFSGNNLKQFGVAAQIYHDEAHSLPPGITADNRGLPIHGWMILLLPQLEYSPLAEKVHLDKPWNDPVNHHVFAAQLPFATIDMRPSPAKDPDGYALTHYAGSVDLLGSTRAWKLGEITDGTSQTVLFGEAAGNYKPWGHPRNARDLRQGINQSPAGFGGPWRSKGGQFAFADGSVHYLNPKIDPKVLEALATPNAKDQGGEY